MGYDEELAIRVRAVLADRPGLSEKRMFGGLAFLIDGKLAVAVSGRGGLMVRVEPGETEALTGEPHAGPFEMRDRPIKGWLRVGSDGVAEDADLRRWIERGVAYASSLGVD